MLTLDQWLAIWGLIIGLLGIAAAYFFYVKSKREPLPWYSVHPLRVHIVDIATDVQGLEIRHKGSLLSDKNITATTVFFGNRGSAPIRSSDRESDGDILEPLVFTFPEGSEVFDARIVKESRPLCGFVLQAGSGSNQVPVSFKIAERDDGFKLQVIHSGDPNAKIRATGSFVGCSLVEIDYAKVGRRALAGVRLLEEYGSLLIFNVFIWTFGWVSSKEFFLPLPEWVVSWGIRHEWAFMIVLVGLLVSCALLFSWLFMVLLRRFKSKRKEPEFLC
jgi:hypothetical protein